jgi:predicted ATP-grasp superfamily ATP-dependent carboligase
MGIKVKIVPVEAYNSVGIVERYYGPIRRAYLIITTKIPGIDKDIALQIAFKAINDTTGPDGLVPTLLVYGALPRIVEYNAPLPTVTQCLAALKKAIAEIQKLQARRQVSDALNTRNGPSTTDIHDLILNSDVLVWREGNTGQPSS